MSTERQAHASRANGAKSRGPVTPQGKRNSSLNATTHGMLADAVVMKDESEDGFHALLNALCEEFNPQTAFEESLVENLATIRWRQIRVWQIETSSLEIQMVQSKERYYDDDDDEAEKPDTSTIKALAFRNLSDESNTIDVIHRYETRYERQYLALHRRLLEVRHRRLHSQPSEPPLLPNEPEK